MTEQRCEARRASRFQVDISHNERYVGRFSTANSGEHSAFVKMDSSGVHAGDTLTVSFIVDESVARRQTHLAQVMRVTDIGIAIVFSQPCRPAAPPVRQSRTGG